MQADSDATTMLQCNMRRVLNSRVRCTINQLEYKIFIDAETIYSLDNTVYELINIIDSLINVLNAR